MLQFNYFIHSILNSKYRLLFIIVIYILIYVTIKNTSTVYCMTEGSDILVTAEPKPTIRPKTELSNLEQLIHRNIDAFVGDKALIERQQEEIARLAREIEFRDEAIKALDTDGMISILVFEHSDNQNELQRICEKYNKPMAVIHPDFEFFDKIYG